MIHRKFILENMWAKEENAIRFKTIQKKNAESDIHY